MTPELSGSLLPGVTRDSLLTLCRELGYTATERRISTEEWAKKNESGELTEVFACGTAAVITPVGSVLHADGGFDIAGGQPGPITMQLREELTDLQYGRQARHARLDDHGSADVGIRDGCTTQKAGPERGPAFCACRSCTGLTTDPAATGQPRTTLPAFRHEVHTLSLRTVPGATWARTGWMFGFQRRCVRRCECETLMPKPGPLPHTSHTAATPNTTCQEFATGRWADQSRRHRPDASPGNLPRVLTRGAGPNPARSAAAAQTSRAGGRVHHGRA